MHVFRRTTKWHGRSERPRRRKYRGLLWAYREDGWRTMQQRSVENIVRQPEAACGKKWSSSAGGRQAALIDHQIGPMFGENFRTVIGNRPTELLYVNWQQRRTPMAVSTPDSSTSFSGMTIDGKNVVVKMIWWKIIVVKSAKNKKLKWR